MYYNPISDRSNIFAYNFTWCVNTYDPHEMLHRHILMPDEIEMSICSNGFKKKLRSVHFLMAAAYEKGCLSAHHALNRNEETGIHW